MNTTQPTEEEYYSDTYFDTDLESDDELNTESRTKSKRKVPTNEELLYDPDMDDKDEAWVAKQINLDSSKKEEDVPLDEKTDAILSCPMCFTTLCYSCQRHERYKDQYRAMFVRNCQTIKNERYKHEDESYYKVNCETCGIQIAMMDEEEIYHFFNVIAN